HVGDPHDPATRGPGFRDLHRGVVMPQPLARGRVGEPPGGVVDIDDQLACDKAVGEGDDALRAVETAIADEAAREAGMYRADVAQRVPDGGGGSGDGELLANGSHGASSRDARRAAWRKLRPDPRIKNRRRRAPRRAPAAWRPDPSGCRGPARGRRSAPAPRCSGWQSPWRAA